MEQITEIKKIEFELLPDDPDGAYSIKINGGGVEKVEYKVPGDNYRQWARIFTRVAMEMWARMDAMLSNKEK